MASAKINLVRCSCAIIYTQSLSSQFANRFISVRDSQKRLFSHIFQNSRTHASKFSSASAPQLNLSHNRVATDALDKKSAIEKRSDMFSKELNRQRNLIPRVEKIEVQYKGAPEEATLLLNKGISTPLDVAQHLSEDLVDQSGLALVNGEVWDMGRPLVDDCTVELMHFQMEEPFHINRAFWRSCSFLLGAALKLVFKEDINVLLHSFPAPNVSTGSFIYDASMNVSDWSATKEELMAISAAMHRLAEQNLPFERIVVKQNLAAEMFAENSHKSKQIPAIAKKSKSGDSVTLYRVGNHVDVSGGPMVGDTSFLGRRCTIAACHKIDYDGQSLYRFQGVALPKGVLLDHVAFGLLEKRASKLNEINLHSAQHNSPA